jgi:hypothetical protein
MKRDYQALALANSLDPKRFMKGGNRAGKIPEAFAVSIYYFVRRFFRVKDQQVSLFLRLHSRIRFLSTLNNSA